MRFDCWFWVVFCAGVLSWPGLGRAQAPAALPPAELFFKEPTLREAVLSPSGRQLALTTARAGKRVGLYVLDLRPGGNTTATALFRDLDIENVRWVNEGRLVFSAVDYSDGGARPHGAPGLFSVAPGGKDFRALVKRFRHFITDGGSDDRTLEWNHFLFCVPQPRADSTNEEVLIGRRHASDNEPATWEPMWLDVRTGDVREIAEDLPRKVSGWHFDSACQARVAYTLKESRQLVHWRGPGDKSWRVLAEHPLSNAPFGVEQVDDAGTLYVSVPNGPAGESQLTRFDFAAGAPQPQPVVSTPGFDYSGRLILERGNGRAMGVRVDTDSETTVWFDEGMARLQAEADRLLPGRVNRLSCRRCGTPEQATLVRSYSDRDPGVLWLHRSTPAAGQRAWERVGTVREGVVPAQMATMAFERIKARDGRDLPVWLTMPSSYQPGQALPTVVLVHGGPWVRGGEWGWHAMPQFLASRGYLVIEPEFRGSAGYGRAHLEAGFKQWGRAMQDDVADALLWAQRRGLASSRACIAGASYGGYSTYMGLIRHPELYRCGVAWVGVADLALFLEGSWWVRDDISKLSRAYTLPEMVGDPVKDAEMLAAVNPLLHAKGIRAPLLIAHGKEDERVPLAHATRMRAALRKSGQAPLWVVYDTEGHGFHLTENQVDFAQRIEAFLEQHLKRP